MNGAYLRDRLAGPVAPDRLVIRRVEYYFHHNVFLIAYTTPNVYQPKASWAADVGPMRPDRLGEEGWRTQILNRADMHRAGTRRETHPHVYSARDNKQPRPSTALPPG